MNITDALYVHARERPEHPAIEDGDRVVTYAGLAALVGHAAASLKARAIKPGDIVVVSLPDTTEHVVVLLALAQFGAVSFSVDGRMSDAEKLKAIKGSGVKAAIVEDNSSRFLDLVSIPINALFEGIAHIKPIADGLDAPRAFDGNSPLMLIQSSGTTGEPKRLLLTHRHMAIRNEMLIEIMRLTPSDRYLQVPYLRFTAGRRRCFVMMALGGTIVLNHGSTPEDYLRYFSERGITYVYFTPYHLRSVLSCLTNDSPLWPTLKIVASAAPIAPGERLLARRRITPLLFESYGTNEVGDLALASPADQDRYPDANGRVIAGVEAQVVDQNGALLPVGQTGLIRFRGEHFPREYSGNPDATAQYFKEGWFYPGDLAAMNEDGYIFLKGRADDTINNAGAKYFPAEVEAVLLSHPSVIDAAVIGGPHAQFGEVSVAYVVRSANLTPKELYKFCDGKIAVYKAPRWVFFLRELPRVATGKPDKKTLKEMFRRYLETQSR